MSFESLSISSVDYQPCRYGKSKVDFRGPKCDLSKPYVAFLGGTHTYGKFVDMPFVSQIGARLDLGCANFGIANAGVDVMVSDPLLRYAAANAEATVIEVVSPRNMSNRFYSVHPTRNVRFVKPSKLLQAIYREIDFSEFHFTKHMLSALHKTSDARFETVVEELKQAWVARMTLLLKQIPGPVVLLWLSDRAPEAPTADLGLDPWFVDPQMLDAVRPMVAGVVEVATPRSPASQELVDLDPTATEGVLGPEVHVQAAGALLPVLERVTG